MEFFPSILPNFLHKLGTRRCRLFHTIFWSYARHMRSLEKGQEGIGGDLETLDVRVQALQGQMGEVISVGDIEVSNITSGLGVLMEKIEDNGKSLRDMSSVIKDNIEIHTKDLKDFEI